MNRELQMYVGTVKSVSDPKQLGRMKVLINNIDPDNTAIDNLPWVNYVSPVGGSMVNYKHPQSGKINKGLTSYGLWAPPQLGAKVVIGIANEDSSYRIYLGCIWTDDDNRTLPGGIYGEDGKPTSPNSMPIYPAYDNVGYFNHSPDMNIAQSITNKNGENGYGKSAAGDVLEPQAYCFTTPGGHYLYMSDRSDNSRITLRSAQGSYIMLDDTEGDIILQSATGNAYLKMNLESGDVSVYSNGILSMAAKSDINIVAGGNLNLQATESVNIVAGKKAILNGESVDIGSCGNLVISGCGKTSISSGGALVLFGSPVMANEIAITSMKADNMSMSQKLSGVSLKGAVSEGAGTVSGQGDANAKSSDMQATQVKATNASAKKAEAQTAGQPSFIPT